MNASRTALLLATAALAAAASTPAAAQRAVIVQNVDEPARAPFNVTLDNGQFVVPAGHRYVIEKYTAVCDILEPQSLASVTLSTSTVGSGGFLTVGFAQFAYPIGPYAGNGAMINRWAVNGSGPLYADAGTTIQFRPRLRNLAGTALDNRGCVYLISGHDVVIP